MVDNSQQSGLWGFQYKANGKLFLRSSFKMEILIFEEGPSQEKVLEKLRMKYATTILTS